MTSQAELAEWIATELQCPPDILNFRLYHATTEPGQKAELVKKLSPEGIENRVQEEAERIAKILWEQARKNAASHDQDRLQRYKVTATSATDKGGRRGEYAWRIDPPKRSALDSGPSEPATPAGLQGALMRHLEAKDKALIESHRVLVDGFTAVLGPLKDALSDAIETNKALSMGHVESIKARAAILSEQHENELEMLEFADNAETKQKLFARLDTAIAQFFMHRGKKNGAASPKTVSHVKTESSPKESNGAAPEVATEVVDEQAVPITTSERAKLERIFLGLPPELAAQLLSAIPDADQDEFIHIMQGSKP